MITLVTGGSGSGKSEYAERLAAAGCAIYRTDWSGTVTITAK